MEKVRDSDLPAGERHKLITYLLGCWYMDQVDGEWVFVPMLVENSALYLSFGVGIRTDNGSMINVAESAREVLEGAELDFKQALYETNVKIDRKCLGSKLNSREE